MKRATKIFWSMCGALVVMGSVFMTAGAVMGANRSAGFGKNWAAGPNSYHVDEQNLSAFQNIDVSVIVADIEVVQSNHYGLKLDLYGRDSETKLDWWVSNGVLKVQEKREEGYFGRSGVPSLFSLFSGRWRQGGSDMLKGEVFVYLPAGTQMEQVSLAAVDGEMTVSGLQAEQFIISSVSGDTELENCKFDATELNLVDGDMEVKDSHLGRAAIDTVSNDIKLERVTTERLSYNSVDADLYFSGELLGETEITGISGNAEFEIDGNREDYWIENSENRKVKIYDDSEKQEKKASDRPNRITVSTMGGECRIRFR